MGVNFYMWSLVARVLTIIRVAYTPILRNSNLQARHSEDMVNVAARIVAPQPKGKD